MSRAPTEFEIAKQRKARRAKAAEKLNDDFVTKGFKRLPVKLINPNPPKIQWGKDYQNWNKASKIRYLEKLAATMNHAADLIQTERNKLMELLVQKEKQVEVMKKGLDQNNEMIQGQITDSNAKVQEASRKIILLNRKVRELEKELESAYRPI